MRQKVLTLCGEERHNFHAWCILMCPLSRERGRLFILGTDDDAPQIEYRLCSLFSGGAFFLSFFPAWMDVERGTGIRH